MQVTECLQGLGKFCSEIYSPNFYTVSNHSYRLEKPKGLLDLETVAATCSKHVQTD